MKSFTECKEKARKIEKGDCVSVGADAVELCASSQQGYIYFRIGDWVK